jgi:branched-chain amino acid transport system permease protein
VKSTGVWARLARAPARRRSSAVRLVIWVAVLAALVFIPFGLPEYLQSLAATALIYGIFAMSLDLLMGYGGMISLGHAAFFGIGGYVAALLMVNSGITSAWIAIPAAMVAAGIGAGLAGLIALRLSGVYFLLVTFALGQLAYSVAQTWPLLTTGGAEGIAGVVYPTIEPFNIEWTTLSFYEFIVVCLVLTYLVLRRITVSPFGITLSAIRQNEGRMRALGYNTWLYKWATFVIAGVFAGGAGALFVYETGIVVPASVNVLASGTVVFMVLIGGSRTLYGSVIGAIVFSLIQYYGSVYLPATWPLFLGIVFVVVVMFAENGIVGAARRSALALSHLRLRARSG